MDLGLDGKRALVGGGGSGIGAGIAAGAGCGRRAADARRAHRRERSTPPPRDIGADDVVADLATAEGPPQPSRRPSSSSVASTCWWSTPAGRRAGTFEAVDEEAWTRAIEGTLQSALRLVRAALPHLREGRDPAILINLSSSVRQPIPALITSNVLRPGLAGLIKSLALGDRPDPDQRRGPGPLRHRPRPAARYGACGGQRPVRGRGPAPDRGGHPARPLRRHRRDRPSGGLPAVARRLRTSPAPSCPWTAAWSTHCP